MRKKGVSKPRLGDPKDGRRRRYCRCVGHELLSSLLNELEPRPWRKFLANPGGLNAAWAHLSANSPDALTLPEMRDLVVESPGDSALPVLRSYLRQRASLQPSTTRLLDDALRSGNLVGVSRAMALATEWSRTQHDLADPPTKIRDHWYAEAISGGVSEAQIAEIPAQIAQAAKSFESHLTTIRSNDTGKLANVFDLYEPVFTADDVEAATDIVIEMATQGPRVLIEAAGMLLRRLSKQEIRERFAALREWMRQTGVADMVITPPLAETLSQAGEFSSILETLGDLIDETRGGRFQARDPVQRDLEFAKYFHEYARLEGAYRRLPYPRESLGELYEHFKELPELSHDGPDEAQIGDDLAVEVQRLSYEALGLLRFLRRFRAGTSRPIVVVGNNRYGRQWQVEPLEQFLSGEFTLRYDGVPSHQSMRLGVPHARNFESSADNTGPWTPDAFPMEFVRQIASEMPHVVVVDSMGPGRYSGLSVFSRAMKTYAHWFVAFNDIRGSELSTDFMPPGHLEELRHWYEYVRLRQQLKEWIRPGPGYRLGLWTPHLTEEAQLGELTMPGTPAILDSDEPQVVLANPMIYNDDALPNHLRGTRPYFFDGPEGLAKEQIVFGFGPYGFQPEVRGTMTASLVAKIQKRVTSEVADMVSEDGKVAINNKPGGDPR
jgi:hypothetical protein